MPSAHTQTLTITDDTQHKTTQKYAKRDAEWREMEDAREGEKNSDAAFE